MNVAVLGYGTIGAGVVKVIQTNSEVLKKNTGKNVQVTRVLDLRDFPGDPVQDILTHDYNDILNDDNIDIIVETMGGTKPAFEFVKNALLKGKSVCSSNKELVAAHGAELIAIAKEKSVNFFFEASVGGGIPIIRPLIDCITADEITQINGILNGTTNFILTKMANEGAEFAEVLKVAQDLGYAEKDPTADVEGFDACRKIAILTSLAYGQQVNYEDIYTEGITKITPEDFAYAKKIGSAVKIFGTSRKVDGKVYAMVAPQIVDNANPLYSVNDVFNAICVTGNMLGDAMFYGAGAGMLPTASAVVADVVMAVRHINDNININWDPQPLEIAPFGEMSNRFFVRVQEKSKNDVESVFGEVQWIDAGISGECGFITKEIKEADFADMYEKLEGTITRIRVS
ncbi:homoserine dehydrogenase [Eubacterium xylanophilum]|uniref:homoserine dehydrogenase n=1 Tax=Eubacterium xylanophilum TaxID=39497 RepID=UPI00047AD0DE|nr:homoserine dehydrogenase [Eubacterium xylanophilum]